MAKVTIATVDEAAADAIHEALEDAGIPIEVVTLRPFSQLAYLRHQQRPLIDIDVDEARAAEARVVLDRFSAEAERALQFEAAGASVGAIAEDGELAADGDAEDATVDDKAAAAARAIDPPRSRTTGLIISLLVPVAGPIYAGSSRFTLLSLALHGAAFLVFLATNGRGWFRGNASLDWGGMIFFVARLVDVVGTQQTISNHDASRDGASAKDSDHAPYA